MPGLNPSDVIRVAVLDVHVVVRYGLELLVRHSPGYGWTGAASTPAELQRLLAGSPCHVLVLDYQLAPDELDGWSLVRHLRAHFPHVRILVYTAYGSLGVAAVMRRAGAHGFVAKSEGLDALLDALRRVAQGDTVFAAGTTDPAASSDLSGEQARLSPRESEVLRCCLQGMSVSDIARKFNRSIKTISAQKHAGFRKLRVHTDHDFLRMYADTRPGSAWIRS